MSSAEVGKMLTSCNDVLGHLARTEGHCLLIVLLRRRCCGQWGRRVSWVWGWWVCTVLLRETHKHNSQISYKTIKEFDSQAKNYIIKEIEYNPQNDIHKLDTWTLGGSLNLNSSNSLQSDEHVCMGNPHNLEYNLCFSKLFLHRSFRGATVVCKVAFG